MNHSQQSQQSQQMIAQYSQALGQFAEFSQASRNHRKEADRIDRKADVLLEGIADLVAQIQQIEKQEEAAQQALYQPQPELQEPAKSKPSK